jgi:hypothetical protein
VKDTEKWSEVAKQYDKVFILTMNTAKRHIEEVCKIILGRDDVEVYARGDFDRRILTQQEMPIGKRMLLAKLHKAVELSTTLSDAKVYFTDDAFKKEEVYANAPIVWFEKTGYVNKDWLVYEQVNPKYDTEHVKKESSCSIWCIDFDQTITTNISKGDYMSSLTSVS